MGKIQLLSSPENKTNLRNKRYHNCSIYIQTIPWSNLSKATLSLQESRFMFSNIFPVNEHFCWKKKKKQPTSAISAVIGNSPCLLKWFVHFYYGTKLMEKGQTCNWEDSSQDRIWTCALWLKHLFLSFQINSLENNLLC